MSGASSELALDQVSDRAGAASSEGPAESSGGFPLPPGGCLLAFFGARFVPGHGLAFLR